MRPVHRTIASHALAAVAMSLPWPLVVVLVWEQVGDGWVLGLAGAARMLPYVAPGRSALQPALEKRLGRLHLAGDYLGGVYTETAIESGGRAANAIRADLDQ